MPLSATQKNTAFPYCKQRKAGRGLGTRLGCCSHSLIIVSNCLHNHECVELLMICVCVSAGVRLKLSQEAIAAAQVFYLTFVSVMDQDEYETTVSPVRRYKTWNME